MGEDHLLFDPVVLSVAAGNLCVFPFAEEDHVSVGHHLSGRSIIGDPIRIEDLIGVLDSHAVDEDNLSCGAVPDRPAASQVKVTVLEDDVAYQINHDVFFFQPEFRKIGVEQPNGILGGLLCRGRAP